MEVKRITRASFRAVAREGTAPPALEAAVRAAAQACREQKKAGSLSAAGIFRYGPALFFYLEALTDGPLTGRSLTEALPESVFSALAPYLRGWPRLRGGERPFAYMTPVFWHDQPVYQGDYVRAVPPEKCCGRIALLRPEKLMSYVTHHQELVREGLLRGDRFQFISLHENVLFSYFETPRDREVVNIRRSDRPSEAIESWAEADPDSHFLRFPESPGENFHVIETLFAL